MCMFVIYDNFSSKEVPLTFSLLLHIALHSFSEIKCLFNMLTEIQYWKMGSNRFILSEFTSSIVETFIVYCTYSNSTNILMQVKNPAQQFKVCHKRYYKHE